MSAGEDPPEFDADQFLANVEQLGRDGLSQLANAIERNEVSDGRVERLRSAIQSLTPVQRARAAASVQDEIGSDIFTPFNALEQALGFQATPPDRGDDVFVTADDDDFTPPEVREEIVSLLGISGGRDIPYFEALRQSFETGEVQPGAPIGRELLNQVADSDAEEFAEMATDRIETLRDREQSPSSGGGGGGSQSAGGGGGTAGDTGFGGPGQLGGPTGSRDMIIAEDWFKDDGTTVSIDPDFVDRFVDLARDLGRARKLDLQPDPMKYFELTPESQETLYDVTPREFIRRAVARNEITPNALRSRGFSEDLIPDPDEFQTGGGVRDRRRDADDEDDEDDEDDRFLGMVG